MVPVDHIIDERTTRFQSATVMESVTIDGRSFVVVGGADDGLSLFTITPDGRLIHLDSIADDNRAALRDVSALAIRVIDGKIVVFAGSATESGVSQFVRGHDVDPAAAEGTEHPQVHRQPSDGRIRDVPARRGRVGHRERISSR